MVNAKEVKKVIKENGINTKKISVRCSIEGCESVIRVTLKDVMLPIKQIETVVHEAFEVVSYDEYSNEILAGGNTFVFVEYDYDTYHEALNAQMEKAETKLRELENQPNNYGYELASKGNLIMYGNKETDQIIITDKTDRSKRSCYNITKYDMACALLALERA